MNIGKTMAKALNEQINAELFSSYLYMSMAAWAMEQNLPGCSKWLMVQAEEERTHALKIFHYLLERGGTVELKKIETPDAKWETPLALFQQVYDHETKVTAMFYKLIEIAEKEKDYTTDNFLKWFIEEQVEEEAQANEIVVQLQMTEGSKGSLFMIDHRLGKRGN